MNNDNNKKAQLSLRKTHYIKPKSVIQGRWFSSHLKARRMRFPISDQQQP